MIVAGSTNPLLLASAGGYNLTNSLRFRSSASAYLNRTPASAGNRRTWTYSAWIKLGSLSNADIFEADGGVGTAPVTWIGFENNKLYLGHYPGGATVFSYGTTAVYRDPSAWYHVVVVCDTTQAVSNDRAKFYINGVLQTSSATPNAISQNTDLAINSNSYVHRISGNRYNGANFLDGYLTEINFIDGQALTPSSFGETSPTTGVWQPKKYAGTYGTNGFYLPFNINTTATYGGYVTDLASNYASLPTGSQGSNFTFSGDFTIEGWVNYPTASGDGSLYVQSDGTNYLALNIDMSAGNYNIYCNSSSTSGVIAHGMATNQWNHVAMVRSGSTITLYTNGVAKGTITNSSTLGFSTLTLNRFGGGASGARYLSNVRINKSAVYTSAFTPPSAPLTNIANTVCLTYQSATLVDNSSNAYTLTATGTTTLSIQYPFSTGSSIANDQSGQGNNWTANNISLANGATYDSMTDVPTLTSATASNFATVNPLLPIGVSGTAVSNGNLTFQSTATTSTSSTMVLPTTGKYYWEATISFGSACNMGIINTTLQLTAGANPAFNTVYGYGYNNADGNKMNNNSVAYGASYTTNDTVGVAFDADTGSLTFYKNGTSQGVAYTGLSGTFAPYWAVNNTILQINFGQRPFAYTPPTGFVALNTYNLPTPTIGATASTQANKYFDATTYTGNGSTQSIVNAGGFQPDMVWTKSRSNAYNNVVNDVLRGSTTLLITNGTDADQTDAQSITSFNSNGYSIGTAGTWNQNGSTFVGWQWKANGTGVTNTDGSITSTVSANTTSGFSVVTYTGNGSSGATIGHGLGVAPKMMIVKLRSGTNSWAVYHESIGTNYMLLNSTLASTSSSAIWNSAPTSTTFTVGNDLIVNTNGGTYVGYMFSEVAGYSKFGSYTGNGSTDGTFVYTGFRPRYILIKNYGAVQGWCVVDTATSTYNLVDNYLQPNSSAAQGSGYAKMDILSNGFKLRDTDQFSNGTSAVYIYAAFAENPFKYSLAR